MTALSVVASGLAGTALMSVSMDLIHRTRLANADMVRALGSMVTRSLDNAFPVGLLIHLAAGIFFAIPYTYVLSSLPVDSPAAFIGGGAAIGVLHGAAMSFVLLAVVAEKHPIEQYRNAGFEVGAAHLVGHVFYGIGVGLVYSLMAR